MVATLLPKKVTPVYKANWEALNNRPERYICNEGGSRSSKSYSIIQVLATYCDEHPGTRVSGVSHSLPHIKRGILRDFIQIMLEWGWYNEKDHNKTEQIYNFPNGSYIEFIGLEEPGKARGPGRDILFVNEANLIGKTLFDQLDMRTTQKVFIDLNPADFNCWCYALADGPNAWKIRSTYRNNITNITQGQIDLIESYREADPEGIMWKVYGLGLRGTSAEQIYTHWKIIDEMPRKGDRFIGQDFGYNVPSATVDIEFYEGAIYADELLYKTKLTTGDLIEELKPLDLGYLTMYCDNAEPKTIEEMCRAGFNAKPADKDVTEGIRKVKSLPLYVTRRSKNLIKELGSYKWKVDKDEQVLDEPVKLNDHACDALRYGVFTHLITPELYWSGK